MEHHSNERFPGRRARTELVHIGLHKDGRLDMGDFEAKLDQYADRVALVSITGGSNVTGFINPIHDLAEMVHTVGAYCMADCAQLAPHRQVEMLPLEDPATWTLSPSPGISCMLPLAAARWWGSSVAESGTPDMVGGGVVEVVTLDDVTWASPPDRDEAGSPNHVGAIAMAAAEATLMKIGMANVAAHEAELTTHALQRLPEVDRIEIYGDANPANAAQRLGGDPL